MSDASNLATAHYPETLDRIFVVGAPSFFPTIWRWIQAWFDPITVAKIHILSPQDMRSTLEKFVDINNIPKKYGGNLDWKFGDMPFLEPEITESLKWKETVEEKGHKTLPKGPIKLHYDEAGELILTAIGTENAKQRNYAIAGLQPEDGVARLALSAGRITNTPNSINSPKSPALITNGHALGPDTKSHKMSNDPNLNVGKDPHSALPHESRAGTYTVPYADYEKEIYSLPADGRQGTSLTRIQQQQGTHAEGPLASGTPEAAYSGQGDRPAVMDPSTVGQAPKEHPLPGQEEAQPSIVDQAKDMAGQVVEQAKELPSTVMSAVGMGEKKEEVPQEPETKKEDPAIDQMSGKSVEEFLRSATVSKNIANNPGA